MAGKTKRAILAETLEDLTKSDFDKFRHYLVMRREEPRIRRARVEDRNFLDVADTMVSTFTEAGALLVAVEILNQIGCREEAVKLGVEVGGETTKAVTAGHISSDQHFVDKHRVELINRVTNVLPILDELLTHNVIRDEVYDQIRHNPTSQGMMRDLIGGPLRASKECKDVFYQILEKHEPYLIKDLNS